jgi:flagellar biosynthesis/type III secretory pathway chaperone
MLIELADALERAAGAMDAETRCVRSGGREELSAAAERKRVAFEAAEALLRRAEGVASAATDAERTRLREAGHRMRAAAARNAATLQGALEGTRRLFACLAQAARQASSTGTYGPDGSARRTEEIVGTIRHTA